ncbi:MAG: YggS family pyridoxal phosphate-dependent enzyme [Candidatus Spyradocola sp.]|jgi:pyridoxal phosphate enzyme (YggS family)
MEATEREVQEFFARVARVRKELDSAAQGRPYTLLAATKTQSAEVINLLPQVGIYDYGENRVQEWVEKREKIDQSLRFHQIGRLQSNKIKYIIDHVVLIHSVDKQELAQDIDKQAKRHGRCVDILLEVNTAREAQKGGVAPEELAALYEFCLGLENVRVRGLMCMAPNTPEEDVVHRTFAQARALFDKLAAQDKNVDILSMGMSQDAKIALEEGSTLVRLGTSLFGRRAGYENTGTEGK